MDIHRWRFICFFIASLGVACGAPERISAQQADDDVGQNQLERLDTSFLTMKEHRLTELFSQLKSANTQDWQTLEQQIWALWSRSGVREFDFILQQARAAMASKNYVLALKQLTVLTRAAPEFSEAWNARATVYYLTGQLRLSANDIAHVLTLEPRHFGALSGLALIFETQGQTEKAIEAYRKSLAIHPQDPRVKEAIRRLTLGQGRDI